MNLRTGLSEKICKERSDGIAIVRTTKCNFLHRLCVRNRVTSEKEVHTFALCERVKEKSKATCPAFFF